MVTIQSATAGTLRLVTNLPPSEWSAAQVGAKYRRRWQVEGFFRWLKCVLGCRHWLAESQRGVTLQLYLALIAGLMLHLILGRRPNRRLMERLRFYLLGWATPEKLTQGHGRSHAGRREKILSGAGRRPKVGRSGGAAPARNPSPRAALTCDLHSRLPSHSRSQHPTFVSTVMPNTNGYQPAPPRPKRPLNAGGSFRSARSSTCGAVRGRRSTAYWRM